MLVGSAPLTASILPSPPDCFMVQFARLVVLADSAGYIHTVPLCGFWNGRVSIENSWCIPAPNVRHSGKSYMESLAGSGGPHLSIAHAEVRPGLAMSLIFPFPELGSSLDLGAGAEVNDSAYRP